MGRCAAAQQKSELGFGGEPRGKAAAGTVVGRDEVSAGEGDVLRGEQDVAVAAENAKLLEGGGACLRVEECLFEAPLRGEGEVSFETDAGGDVERRGFSRNKFLDARVA